MSIDGTEDKTVTTGITWDDDVIDVVDGLTLNDWAEHETVEDEIAITDEDEAAIPGIWDKSGFDGAEEETTLRTVGLGVRGGFWVFFGTVTSVFI